MCAIKVIRIRTFMAEEGVTTMSILSCSVPDRDDLFVCNNRGVPGALECYGEYMAEMATDTDDRIAPAHHTISIHVTETGFTCNEMTCESMDIEVPIISSESFFVVGVADADMETAQIQFK